jgi:Ca-activated chloride channel family protein
LALPSEVYQNESYAPIREIEFVTASETPLSTFSIDVDTASYSNVRRFLEEERTPPADAIRTEELINYFRYNYPQPSGENAFSVNLEINRAPWNPEHELVRVGLKGREPSAEDRGPANLVFLVDVSGSMNSPDKLPLLQRSLSALVENLSDDDRVAIVTYAGSSGLVLDSTQGKQKREILDAIANLRSGGSTNGSGGIKQAYETARQNFFKGGNNRVILCTDGDFNVGVTDQGALQKLIETERASGVFLSVLGFGRGNLKDSTMEMLADKGNGNYAYIDSISEGRKVLVEQMGSTLFTIAKDVKIQVEFNPARVAGYRLIGYENRLLAKEDFNNDKIDAGEIGAGHTVTALYEIIPAGQTVQGSPTVDPLKYQQPEKKTVTASNEILTVKVRYKAPDGEKSRLLEIPLAAVEIPSPDKASEDFRFATAVAAFGMKLRGSPHVGEIKWTEIQDIARGALGKDPGSYRAEFLTLIEKAKALEKEEK